MKNLLLFFMLIFAGNWLSAQNHLVAYEYWFNANEGRQIEPILPAAQHNLNTDIDASNLPDGVNVFNIRYKDENGIYSSTLSQLFYKNPGQLTLNNKLVSYEYWFNNDDDNKKVENIALPASQHSLNTDLDVAGLPDGVNMFNIRYKDEKGIYSGTLSTIFYKLSTKQITDNKLIAYRYWLDSSFDKVETVKLASGVSPIALVDDLDLTSVPKGRHAIHFQFQDSAGAWSVVSTDSITKTANPIAAFSFFNTTFCANGSVDFINESNETDTWLWDFGDGTTSTEFEPEHVYAAAGDFDVSLIATDSESGLKDTVIQSIVVYPTQENEVSTEICASELPVTFGTQSLTTSGIYTETFQTIYGCDSVVTFNLTVNPTYNVSMGQISNFLVNDSFEEDALGSLPDGWRIRYNGTGNANQKIVDNPVKNGIQSFQVSGSGWAANLSKAITSFPEKVALESWVRIENVAASGNCGLSIGNPSVATWGSFLGRVETASGNFITYNHSGSATTKYVLSPVESQTWYHIKIEYDFSAGKYSVYINNEQTSGTNGAEILTEFPLLTSVPPTSVEIYGNSMVYFEDVKLYETGNTELIICASETPYTFGTQQLSSGGQYTETFQTINGCDSIVTLNLVINPVYAENEKAAICDSELPYIFGTQSLVSSGDYAETFQTVNGCDSIITLTLNVNPTYKEVETKTVCSNELPVIFGSQSLTTAGDYTETFQTDAGCDSIVTLTLVINSVYNETITKSVCESELPYVFGTQSLSVSGDYNETFQSISGCDSIVDLTLKVNSTYDLLESYTVCESELPFIFGAQSLVSSGDYAETFQTVNGCDSIITLTLNVNPTYKEVETKTVCSNELPVIFGSQSLTTAGDYTETFQTDAGCDSVVNLTLVVNETQNINITDYIYIEDLPYIFETQQLTQSGTYSETYQGLNGCDSTIWLTLSVIDTSIVIDIIPPTLNCNEIDIYLNKDGRYILKPADFKALSEGTTDNVSAPEDIQIDVFRKAFYCKDSGNKIEVKVSATDEAGNEASCFVFLLVQDTFDLSVEQIDDIEVMLAPGVCETSITYPAFVTSNMCAQFTQIAGLGEQGFFPVGITKEEWVLTNRSGDTLSFSFNVIVSSINDLPTIHPVSNTSVHEDSQELQIPLSGISYGIDCEHQEIEVKANGINSDLVTNIAVDYSATDSTAIVILTFAPDMSGSDEITVTVSDSEGESVEESFVVTVIPVNDPPVLVNPIPDFKLNASYPHKIQLTDSPDGFFVDVDNTGLIFKLFKEDGSDLPDWITIENDSLIINPMFADTGCVSLVIKAIDTNGGMTKDTFSICVEGYPTGNTVLETAKFDVQMYPNPTTGEVYLKINTTVILDSEVIVRNIAGSEVLKKEFQAAEMIRIDFSDHVSGIYLVTLKTGDKSVVKKLILNR